MQLARALKAGWKNASKSPHAHLTDWDFQPRSGLDKTRVWSQLPLSLPETSAVSSHAPDSEHSRQGAESAEKACRTRSAGGTNDIPGGIPKAGSEGQDQPSQAPSTAAWRAGGQFPTGLQEFMVR